MTTKTFLTSAVAMGFIAPVMAAPTNTGTFPSGGLMQADYTYTNAATSTNMDGVYEGTVNAEAQYEDVLYQIAVGKYLPANSETTIDCDQNGYFCAGDNNGVYYSSSAQGLTQCPTGYGNTANGASANTDCYRTCTNADVEHSTGTMNGGYYYGDNNQCEPTDCVNGWHVNAGFDLSDRTEGEGKSYGINGTWCDAKHNRNNTFYSCSSGEGYDYANNHNRGDFSAEFENYKYREVTGISACASELVDRSTLFGGQNTGEVCYCKIITIDGNTVDSTWQKENVSSGYGPIGNSCANYCTGYCMMSLAGGGGNLDDHENYGVSKLASCAANTITINWGDTDLADVTANEAGTATYGSDIRTPVKAQTKAGKRFTGWRFSKPTQTTLP